ncbi:hypothetical protein DFR70_101402 [Nocardia tenerifensis]|uniref:Uncharacterized protein n=1 Tax=Nocardia tenerifensis TaxID=228006 RepID=A0A318K8X4_9NOCA|nr:hypothetical protein [Nocardia tenerifensis]PXX70981.1 hypothetical protein DFR70_101402 [Nocardia tenerifensis]
MAVLSRPATVAAIIIGVTVGIPALATLGFAAHAHPECATIPQDVGPCGYWARVAEYGPFIMLWGTAVLAGLEATLWLLIAAALGIAAALRRRHESSTDSGGRSPRRI